MDPNRQHTPAASGQTCGPGRLPEGNDASRDVLDASPLAVVSYDPEGVVTYWNPAAELTFGWPPEEAVGRRLPFVPAEKQAEFEELLKRALTGEAFIEPELHRRRSDGSPIVVSVAAAPLRGRDGTVCAVMEILTDVTERKNREESQACLLAALEQAGDSIVVTDARGVIQYVNAAFERNSGFRRSDVVGQKPKILASGRQDEEFYRKLWEAIGRGETWRGTLANRKRDGSLFEEDAVISPVRDAAGRIVSYVGIQRDAGPCLEPDERTAEGAPLLHPGGRRPLFQPRSLDMNCVLTGMDRMLRRLAGDGIEISLCLGRSLGLIRATPGKVEQLIAGLALHARGTMPGGGRLTIRTAETELPSAGPDSHPGVPPGSYVVLTFEGYGQGMERGYGAGPEAACGIARQIDGHIRIERPEGQRSALHVYLPRVEPSAEEEAASERIRAGSLAIGTETVLLVEDEDVVRLPAREILRTCGYTVIEARHGKEALLLSDAHPGKIDLALTDVMMPKMDGLELVNRLHEVRPDTRILFMSGYTDCEIGRIADPENGIAFLQKPFTAEALSFKIREVLDAC